MGDGENKLPEAIAELEKAEHLDPKSEDIAGWYANFLVTSLYSYALSPEMRESYSARLHRLMSESDASTTRSMRLGYAQCQYLRQTGQYSMAIVACRHTQDITPWSTRVSKEIGYVLLELGQLDSAIASFDLADQLAGARTSLVSHTWIEGAGIALLLKGRDQEALTWLRRIDDPAAPDPKTPALVGLAYFRVGDRAASARRAAQVRVLKADFSSNDLLGRLFPARSEAPNYLQTKISQLGSDLDAMLADTQTNGAVVTTGR
jgi:Flp pilus assembly protein TadD